LVVPDFWGHWTMMSPLRDMFPDLDALFMVFGKHYYLRHHQSITHSIFLAPVYALIISSSFLFLPEIDWSWSMFREALMGLLLHITFDWFNTSALVDNLS